MSKLRDLHNLLPDVADVTMGRANVWIMEGRKAGLFITGGRGVNAPEIGPRDVANGLLFALQLATPKEAPRAVLSLRDTPLFTIAIDPGDGGSFREFDQYNSRRETLNEKLPPALAPIEHVDTLGSALDRLFDAEMQIPGSVLAGQFDRITHELSGETSRVTIEIAEKGYEYAGWHEAGDKAWKLVFETDTAKRGRFGTTTTKIVHGDALRALRDLLVSEKADPETVSDEPAAALPETSEPAR